MFFVLPVLVFVFSFIFLWCSFVFLCSSLLDFVCSLGFRCVSVAVLCGSLCYDVLCVPLRVLCFARNSRIHPPSATLARIVKEARGGSHRSARRCDGIVRQEVVRLRRQKTMPARPIVRERLRDKVGGPGAAVRQQKRAQGRATPAVPKPRLGDFCLFISDL